MKEGGRKYILLRVAFVAEVLREYKVPCNIHYRDPSTRCKDAGLDSGSAFGWRVRQFQPTSEQRHPHTPLFLATFPNQPENQGTATGLTSGLEPAHGGTEGPSIKAATPAVAVGMMVATVEAVALVTHAALALKPATMSGSGTSGSNFGRSRRRGGLPSLTKPTKIEEQESAGQQIVDTMGRGKGIQIAVAMKDGLLG